MYYVTFDPTTNLYIVEDIDGNLHSMWEYSSHAYDAAAIANGE